MRARALIAAGLVAAGISIPVAPPAPASDAGETSVNTPNISHVANLQYNVREYPIGDASPFKYAAKTRQGGTDLELTTLTVDRGNGPEERDFAVTGSYRNGLHLVDVTVPTAPVEVLNYDCAIAQGDIQVFKRGDKTYAAFAQDDIPADALYTSACFQEMFAKYGLGTPATPGDADTIPDRFGTFIVDISNPYAPETVRTVGWVRWDRGSHNATVDPTGMFLYNSNQDLIARTPQNGQGLYQIEVFSLADVENPTLVAKVPLNTGAGPHDITFNDAGTRAYVAAISHTVVLDTTDMAAPKIVGTIVDPEISIHHQADPITVGDRTYVVVSDELAGVIAGAAACPGGGLHIYDVTGSLEAAPVKVGYFGIPQASPSTQPHLRCTAHVFKAYPEQGIMTIAWYGAGVRVLDISGLAGVSVGTELTGSVNPVGIKEIGSFYFPSTSTQAGSQLWAVKALRLDADGSGYLFGNDLDRGFEVFHFDATAGRSVDPGTWVAGTAAGAVQALEYETGEDLDGSSGATGESSQPLPYCVILPAEIVEG